MSINFLKIKENDFPFFSSLTAGRISGIRWVFNFGTNTAISNSVYEDIWSVGGVETLLTSTETINIVSDNPNDSSDGTVLRTIRVKGLDASYNLIEEDITLNGTTPVTTILSYFRMYRAFGLTSGSSNSNEGTITLTSSGSATVMGEMLPTENQTQKTQFTIPARFYGFLLSGSQSGEQGNDWIQRFRVKEPGFSERTINSLNASRPLTQTNFTIPLLINPQADIKIQAKSTDVGPVSVTANYQLMLVNEELVNPDNSDL